MFSYMREMIAGYLILRPNLGRLFEALAEWEPTYMAGTIVAGRRRGKPFARLNELDISELLTSLQPGQSINLLGDSSTVTYLRLVKLDQDEIIIIDLSPSLIQFEFDRSCQSADTRLSEGIVLHGLQIFVPFVLLTQDQLAALLAIVKQHIPMVREDQDEKGLITPDARVVFLRQFETMPQRTILTVTNPSKPLLWRIDDKAALYVIGYTLLKELGKM